MCARGVDGTRDEREIKEKTNNTKKMNKNGHNDNDDQGTRHTRDEGEEKATHTAAGQGQTVAVRRVHVLGIRSLGLPGCLI